MRLLTASLTACSAVLLIAALAGCGGDENGSSRPRIDRVTAQQLASLSDDVADLAGSDECAAAERADDLYNAAQDASDRGRVPEALRSELIARAEELRNELNCPPPPTTTAEEEDDHGKGKGKDKGKKRGHGGDEG